MPLWPFRTPPCPGCGERSTVQVDVFKLDRWLDGEHIQNVWPEKTPAERELMMTGYHDECFEEACEQLKSIFG